VDLPSRHGSGIPPEKLPRIFRPLYTTKSGPDESGKRGPAWAFHLQIHLDAHAVASVSNRRFGKGTALSSSCPCKRPREPIAPAA